MNDRAIIINIKYEHITLRCIFKAHVLYISIGNILKALSHENLHVITICTIRRIKFILIITVIIITHLIHFNNSWKTHNELRGRSLENEYKKNSN